MAGTGQPTAGLGRGELYSAPALPMEFELRGSILLAFELGKHQSPEEGV